MMKTRRLSRLVAVSTLLILAGCASPGVFKFSKQDFPKSGPKNPVVRILGMWEPAKGMFEGKSCRGFSAQVLFFAQHGDLPAQVDGDVRIYVFDDQGKEEDRATPFHEFVDPAETWNAFLSNGPLGATYSVFIPYSRPGFHEANCALRIRYSPKTGFPTYSELVNIVLPGTKKAKHESQTVSATSLPNRDATVEASQAADSARNPPRARGFSATLPTPDEIQEQLHAKRPRAAELNVQERRRIMREAAARLESENKSEVALAGYDEPEPAATETKASRPKTRNPQSDDDDDFYNATPGKKTTTWIEEETDLPETHQHPDE
jgi:hypothetical protein